MRKLSAKQKYWIWSVLFLVTSAVFLVWFLQYRAFFNDAGRATQFLWEQTKPFLYSAFIMLLILGFFTGLTRRPAIAVGIVTAIIIAVTFAHINKFAARGAPLLPEDFQLASEAQSMIKFIDIGELIRTILAIILVFFLSIILNTWWKRKFSLRESSSTVWFRRLKIMPRIVTILVSIVVFMMATEFIRHHQGQRRENVDWLGTQFVAWNQVENYEKNGFLVGFLYNLQTYEITEPGGYGENEINAIRQKYAEMAESGNQKRSSIFDEDVNVIIVLNESFYDMALIEEYYPYEGEDVLPNLHSIQKQYPSGSMYSLDYGGGTANIEFEALTGLSNYWAATVPYTDIIPKRGDLMSIALDLRERGYKTSAIHPFNGSMYKRNISLANLGVSQFITEAEIKYKDKDGASQYINDRSVYRELLDVLNSGDERQMIAVMTMQNHMPYDAHNYDETNFKLTDMADDPGRKSEIEIYLQSLHNSDEYLGELIKELDESNKKVAMLFFGDHSPGVFDRTNGHEEKEVRDLSRMVPYFIYTNYDESLKKPTSLPLTTPNCMTNTMLDILGVEKPTFYYLLGEVCREVPVLANAYFGDTTPGMTGVLGEYELVNYDLLGGKKYWMK